MNANANLFHFSNKSTYLIVRQKSILRVSADIADLESDAVHALEHMKYSTHQGNVPVIVCNPVIAASIKMLP